MGLFKRKKQEEIDPRTELEKKFEEKGQQIGKKTGSAVQRGLDKVDQLKQRFEDDGTMDKLRQFSDKIDDTIDGVVDGVVKKSKKLAKKKNKKQDNELKEDDLFYE